MARQTIGHVDEDGGTDGHQDIGAQTGRPLPVLPLKADQAAEDKGGRQAQSRIDQRYQIDMFKGLQGHGARNAARGALGRQYRDHYH
jgi:hypothetical protein